MEDKIYGCTIIVEDKLPGKFKEYGKFYFYGENANIVEGMLCVNGKTLFAKASYKLDENDKIVIKKICATDLEKVIKIQLGDDSYVCNVATAQKEYDKVEIDSRIEKLKGKESSIAKKNILKAKQEAVSKYANVDDCLCSQILETRKPR